ncbi:MAG: oligosaccharide flippase family protein [Hungatella sp.]|nr:oligosaccharide flippase family protein [Hungatella sp.]
MTNQKENRNSIIKQGSILAVASITVRIIGLIYRIPMANIIGEKAMGIYSAAFEIYNIILILSSYSMPLAVSKLISEKLIQRRYKNANIYLLNCFIFSIIVGLTASLFLYFNASWIESSLLNKYAGVSKSLKILAPTIFIVSVMGVFRGFFQGKSTMVPTAVSQVIEQIINAVVSIAAASYLISINSSSPEVAAWGAAGGTLGTCIGALSGLLFLIFIFVLYSPNIRRQMRKYDAEPTDSIKIIYQSIFITVIPIILSQTVYQVNGVIDISLFNNIMGRKGFSETDISILQGNYSTLYKLLISVPIAISSSFGGSMIPSIVSSHTNKKYHETRKKISSAILFNMNIAFPSAIGLMVLGKPVLSILFPRYNVILGGNLLLTGASAILFYAYSTITSSTLQGINKMKFPVINSAIGLFIHIGVVYLCLNHFNLGIYSLIIGNITLPLIVMILNSFALNKYLSYRENKTKIFLKPFLCSVIMGVICYAVYHGIYFVIRINSLSVLLAITVSVFAYFYLILKFGGISGEELTEFPAGRTLYRAADKLHLIH